MQKYKRRLMALLPNPKPTPWMDALPWFLPAFQRTDASQQQAGGRATKTTPGQLSLTQPGREAQARV